MAVAIVAPASQQHVADPVVFMSGGPGGAALGLAGDLIRMGLNEHHELVLMDQRGVGDSLPALTCPSFATFRAESVGWPYDSRVTERHMVAAARACRKRLVSRHVDLGAFNTTENAADYAALRRTLKIRAWNVYAGSYGTDLALVYMREHPHGVRSVIIDSVVPPDVATPAWTWSSDKRGIDGVFRACAAQPVCNRHFPHLGRVFAGLVRRFEAHPVTTHVELGGQRVKVVLDGGALVNWLQQHTILPATIPADIYALKRGNPHPAAILFAFLQRAEPLSRGMHFSVLCSEWVPYERPSALLRAGRKAFPSYPTSVLRLAPALPFLSSVCRIWKVPKAPASIRKRTISSIPTLAIGGGFDAVTGTQWARYAVARFPHHTYINIPGVSHFVALDSHCAQQVMRSFLDRPEAPNTACVRALKPAPFSLKPTARPPGEEPPGDDGPL